MPSELSPPATIPPLRFNFASGSEELDKCVERLKALADPQRLRIITALMSGPKTVGRITEELNDEMPRVSHHLSVLRQSGILTATKRGRFVEYALPDEVPVQHDERKMEYSFQLGLCRLIVSAPAPADTAPNSTLL